MATVWTINCTISWTAQTAWRRMALVVCNCGVAAWAAGLCLALLSSSVAASALAFLLFNFPPRASSWATSVPFPLGFLAAALGIEGWDANAWPLWFPVLVFRLHRRRDGYARKRLLRGERVWGPSRALLPKAGADGWATARQPWRNTGSWRPRTFSTVRPCTR